MSGLDALRGEISELDRRLLELLNRRLELVAAVRDYKDAAGERWIDPEREAELLQTLVAANPGPLTERGVGSIFSAILDVLKQEVAAERRAPASPEAGTERPRAIDRLAVRSEEHTSELQSPLRISYAVFCLKKNSAFPI